MEHAVTGIFNTMTRRIWLDEGDMAGQEVKEGRKEELHHSSRLGLIG